MIKLFANILKPYIASLPTGTTVDVPYIKSLMGRNYVVGRSNNSTWGRALSELAKQGYLALVKVVFTYNRRRTTIHTWVTV